jgi:hypothetical protein
MTAAALEIFPYKLPRLGLRFGFVNNRGQTLRAFAGEPRAKSRNFAKMPARFMNGDLIFLKFE